MAELRKYATAATIYFPLIGRDSNDLKASATLASGDFKISIDGGAFANTNTATPTDEGNGIYSLPLTSGETTGKVIVVTCIDQTATKNWEDQVIIVETYGHASALHPFDLGTASVAQTGDNYARIGAPVGASISADIAGVQSDTNDIQTRLPAALVSGRMDSSVGAMAADVVTASAIAANAIGSSEIADGAITAAKIATDAIDADALAADAIAEINATVDTALADYDAPTSAELVSEINSVQADIAALTIPSATSIADAVLSRPISNVEGSAAFRTLAGAIAKLVNRVRVNGSSFEVYKTDDATLMGTQTATTDAAAEPIKELNTD